MYHMELRQFPHSAWRFNLDEAQMRAVAEPFARAEMVGFGERKWNPHKATLTILEGPHLALQELSMGRGWRAAQRQSTDVTQRVLGECAQLSAAAAEARVAGAAAAEAQAAGVAAAEAQAAGMPAADPLALGVQIAALLGQDPMALLDAWRAAASSSAGLRPSESLALAEQKLERPPGS